MAATRTTILFKTPRVKGEFPNLPLQFQADLWAAARWVRDNTNRSMTITHATRTKEDYERLMRDWEKDPVHNSKPAKNSKHMAHLHNGATKAVDIRFWGWSARTKEDFKLFWASLRNPYRCIVEVNHIHVEMEY